MNFFNRTNELQRLQSISQSKEGGLAVLYGRRRIGKSRLLLEWASGSKYCYFVADKSAAAVQRKYMARSLETVLPDFSRADYPDWDSLFSRLITDAQRASWRGPLILDEFPYLVEQSPELPSILQRFVDSDFKKLNMITALSGSSQRMMNGIVLDHDAPLYGRARELLRLGPVSFPWLTRIFPKAKLRTLFELFAVFGGIPKYLELALQCNSVDSDRIVDRLVLDPLGPLHEEPDRLLATDIPSSLSLRPLLDIIGGGAHRVSEIAGRMGSPATSLSKYLARLIEMDLVIKEQPFGESLRSGKRTLYKISDPFFNFWFTVVAPNRGYLMQASQQMRMVLYNQHSSHIRAQIWESLCRYSFLRLSAGSKEPKTGNRYSPACRFWQGNGPEWDIVSMSQDKKTGFIGEAKWIDDRITGKQLQTIQRNLLKKGLPNPLDRKNCEVHYGIFVPEKPRGYASTDSSVHVFDLKDIFAALAP